LVFHLRQNVSFCFWWSFQLLLPWEFGGLWTPSLKKQQQIWKFALCKYVFAVNSLAHYWHYSTSAILSPCLPPLSLPSSLSSSLVHPSSPPSITLSSSSSHFLTSFFPSLALSGFSPPFSLLLLSLVLPSIPKWLMHALLDTNLIDVMVHCDMCHVHFPIRLKQTGNI